MKRVTATSILISMILLGVGVGYGQKSMLGLTIGLSKFAGDDSKNWETGIAPEEKWDNGFSIGGEFNGSPVNHLYLGGRVGYNLWRYTDSSTEGGVKTEYARSKHLFEIFPINVKVVSSPILKIKYYAQVSAGIYFNSWKEDVTESYTTSDGREGTEKTYEDNDSGAKGGMCFGVGALYKNYSLSSTYNIVDFDGESVRYFSINLGFFFMED